MPELHGIILVVEGSSDVRTVRGFAERALFEKSTDFDSSLFQWRGIDDDTPFLQWSRVKNLMRDRKVSRRYGHFEGSISEDPGEIYARQARNALTLCHELGMPLAVVMVCDADAQPQRLEGLKQARVDHENFYASDYPVVIGVANPCREAWVMCGFEAKSHELDVLARIARDLTFDPIRTPHRLTTAELPHNAKRVLESFVTNPERETACWQEGEYRRFHANGSLCGLKEYLEEVEKRLAVLLGVG
jgi:hypothetical protein